MTDAAAPYRPSPDPRSDWAATLGVLMSYAYLGSRPWALDSTTVANVLDLRSDLRTPAGAVLGSPLAIAMLDAVLVSVESMRVQAVTQIDVNIIDCAIDVRQAYLASRVTTEMRSQIFTEARISDADIPERHIGFATANWAVIKPTPHRFCFPEPGALESDHQGLPPLWHAYSGRRRLDGTIEIPHLDLEVGAERLHYAPMLVVTEAVALQHAADALGTDQLVIEHLAMTIVAPGCAGPFIAAPVFCAVEGDSVGCRVELRDAGRGARLVAATFVRMQMYR